MIASCPTEPSTPQNTPNVYSLYDDPVIARNGPYPLWLIAPYDLPCRGQDPDLWFAEAPAQLERAKGICRDCPVRLACLRGAIERQEPWGVWGGEIFVHGVVVARKRGRGRPRKTDPVAEHCCPQSVSQSVDELAS